MGFRGALLWECDIYYGRSPQIVTNTDNSAYNRLFQFGCLPGLMGRQKSKGMEQSEHDRNNKVQSTGIGPTWPDVAGLGCTPNSKVLQFFRYRKICKMCRCIDTCPASRFMTMAKSTLWEYKSILIDIVNFPSLIKDFRLNDSEKIRPVCGAAYIPVTSKAYCLEACRVKGSVRQTAAASGTGVKTRGRMSWT